MAAIFSYANPKVLEQFRATSTYYHYILPKYNYTIHTPTVDEIYAIIRHISAKLPDEQRHISFAIKKPSKKVLEDADNIISEISKLTGIASLDMSESNLEQYDLERLAALTNLQELIMPSMPNEFYYMTRLTKLTLLRLSYAHQFQLGSFANLRELSLTEGFYSANTLERCKYLPNPELLTTLYIKTGHIDQHNVLRVLQRITNLVDLFLACRSYDSGDHSTRELPLNMTNLRSLRTNLNHNPAQLAANVHLTRLRFDKRMIFKHEGELSNLINLRELSLVDLATKVQAEELEFISNIALRSLTVLSACYNYDFLEHVRADHLKELQMGLIKDQISLEALSRLTALDSLTLTIYPANQSPVGFAKSFNLSSLTLLTRLVTPRAFVVKGLECLPSLVELVTMTPIDVQSLARATQLTKLEAGQVHPESILPASLQELVVRSEPVTLSTLTNLTRLELGDAKSSSWITQLTKLKKLEIMNFITKADLARLSALTDLAHLSVGYMEELPSDGHPFILLTKLQSLQLSGTSEQALQFITSKLPRLLV